MRLIGPNRFFGLEISIPGQDPELLSLVRPGQTEHRPLALDESSVGSGQELLVGSRGITGAVRLFIEFAQRPPGFRHDHGDGINFARRLRGAETSFSRLTLGRGGRSPALSKSA